jgi:4-carboxymuconolactone decarboxylase
MISIDLVLTTIFGVTGDAPRSRPSRVRPLDSSEWSPEVAAMLGATRQGVADLEGGKPAAGHKTLNILHTIAHLPNLLGPFLGFAAALAQKGELTRRDSELLALRAAWNCQSEFEWGHHAVYARAAGVGDDEIASLARDLSSHDWSAHDLHLLRAADQLHAHQQISDDVWSELATAFTEAQLVEIPFVVGQYTMLSMVANSTGVELEPGHDSLPPSAGGKS